MSKCDAIQLAMQDFSLVESQCQFYSIYQTKPRIHFPSALQNGTAGLPERQKWVWQSALHTHQDASRLSQAPRCRIQSGTRDCYSAGAICGKEPAIQPGTGKGGVVRAETLELPAKSWDEKCFRFIKISRGEFHIIDFVVFQHLQILGAVINASKRPRKKRGAFAPL